MKKMELEVALFVFFSISIFYLLQRRITAKTTQRKKLQNASTPSPTRGAFATQVVIAIGTVIMAICAIIALFK